MKQMFVYNLVCADCQKELGTVAYYSERGDIFLEERMKAQICNECAAAREQKRIDDIIKDLRNSVKE